MPVILKSPLVLLCIFICYAQGILILNVIVSLKRNDRKIIFKSQLAIPFGLVSSLLVLVIRNLNSIVENSFTFEIFTNQIFIDEIIALVIVGIISTPIYIAKEILYVKDGSNNE